MKVLLKLICIFMFAVTGNYLFLSCSEKEKGGSSISILEVALQQAGDNRAELEKVLSRYKMLPEDSLKYKAACFLIENIPYYTYYKGKPRSRIAYFCASKRMDWESVAWTEFKSKFI